MAAAHAQTAPLSPVPKAVPVDFAPGNRPIFSGGTLINTMKTWSEEDFEKLQEQQWPWGKLASSNPRVMPSVDLEHDKYTVGRNASCDCVVVNVPSVSGLHCTIEREQQNDDYIFWLTDHSSNGTWAGGAKVGRGNRVQIRNRTEVVIVPPGPNRPKISYFFFAFKTHPADEVAPEGDVAFVFTDVQSSTKLWEAFPEMMDKALVAHDDILRKNMVLNKVRIGYEVKTEGDAFFVAFGSVPRAIAWCLGVQEALLKHDWDPEFLKHESTAVEESRSGQGKVFAGLRIRMGIHVGRPNCRRNKVNARMDYFGPCVNEAARVSDSAHGGQVVCTDAVMQELEKLGGLEKALADFDHLKGVTARKLGDFSYKGVRNKIGVHELSTAALQERKFPPLRVHEE